MNEFLKWGKYHGISHGTLLDYNYGLSYPKNGTMPFMNRCIVARITVEQRIKLLAMNVDPIFISPPLIRRTSTVHLMLIYCSDTTHKRLLARKFLACSIDVNT